MKRRVYPVPTKEMITAAANVIAARAYVETIRPKITAIHDSVLSEENAVDENGNAVTWNTLYVLGEEVFIPIIEKAQAKIREAGFYAPEDKCPLLLAESAVRNAEWELNKLAVNLLPQELKSKIDIETVYDPVILKKLTELNLKYILNR